jgi:outer membrane protein
MKMLLKRLIPGMLLLPLLCAPACAQTRIATVNVQKVFNNYWKTKQADALLLERQTEMEKTRTEMLETRSKAREDYQKLAEAANDQAVSAEERDKRKKEAGEKLKDIKDAENAIDQFQRQAAATLGEQKARMRRNITDEIKLAVASRARTGGFTLVVDADAQTYIADPIAPYYISTILYNNNDSDITDSVVDLLNAGAPGAAPRQETKPQTPVGGKK